LWAAAAPDRIEWYVNNIRQRLRMQPGRRQLLPSGTASNEALHAEMNRWFRQTQQIHPATLKLKLRCCGLGKLIAHNSAMYSPTLRQISPAVALARVASAPWWTKSEWIRWCRKLYSKSIIDKANTPLFLAKQAQAKTVAIAVKKRPASVPRHDRKRTPFTRKRQGRLLLGGVRQTIFKRPASK
jgi:hypothetical protein